MSNETETLETVHSGGIQVKVIAVKNLRAGNALVGTLTERVVSSIKPTKDPSFVNVYLSDGDYIMYHKDDNIYIR